MNLAPLTWVGRSIDRGPNKRVAECHGPIKRQQPLGNDGSGDLLCNAKQSGGIPKEGQVAKWLCSCHKKEPLSVTGQRL